MSLDNTYDIGASGNGEQGCTNLKTIAGLAKAQDILIIIGFGSVNTQNCGGGTRARDALAAAASNQSAGMPSQANGGCSTTAERATENSDKDWYFCAATGDDLKRIFAAAMDKINGKTRFLKVLGVSD